MMAHTNLLLVRSACALAALATTTSCFGKCSSPESTQNSEVRPIAPPDPGPSLPALPCLPPLGLPGPVPMTCTTTDCGNSARVNDSIIEALDTKGEQVQDIPNPFRILPGTLTTESGGCHGITGLNIEVADGDLVGVVNGKVKCKGADLVGAQFRVVQETTRAPLIAIPDRTYTIKITHRQTIAAWVPPKEDLPIYLLEKVSPLEPVESEGVPLCPKTLSSGFAPERHALLVQGEVYRKDGSVDKARTGPRWFNIACMGSALAKMRLLGFDPMSIGSAGSNRAASTASQRQATLKMITAKYCGASGWTKDGTYIYMVGHGDQPFPPLRDTPGPDPDRPGPIESRWGENGATCVSHLRLWSVDSKCAELPESYWVQQVQQTCHIPACDETAQCLRDDEASSGKLWKTCTVNHVSD